MPGLFRYCLAGAVLAAGLGAAALQAQTVLGDPRDAARTFASNCSACHKSPRGLAKSGQVAGFLRQHYTTGAEMSAAMAAYLVAAGAAPPEKKTAAKDGKDDGASAKRGKKEQQIAATPPAAGEERTPAQPRTLRGKQQRPGSQEEVAPAAPHQQPSSEPAQPAQQVATSNAANAAQPAAVAAPAASSPQSPPLVLDIPLPPMPEGPPADLTQSAFSSSPLP